MVLRCFLFSSDEGTSDIIRQVTTGLGVEGESCSQATIAVDKLTRELFQIVIIDWDMQPEAGMLISAARERRAAERPLTIAIVSDDASSPKALQAGANSILRKPLLQNQVTDTLTTARDLLRSRQQSASAAAAGASSSAGSSAAPVAPSHLRAGEFLQSTPVAPGGQFETDSEVAHFREQSAADETDPLKDLEPVAAAVGEQPPAELAPTHDEPKGLEWYLKARGVTRQPGSVLASAAAPAPAPTPAESAKPELLGYDQTPSSSDQAEPETAADSEPSQKQAARVAPIEPQLFSSYIDEEETEAAEPRQSHFRLKKGWFVVALILAAAGIAAAPQAPWHGKLVGLTARGKHAFHGWLNPQPVTAVTQEPVAHEDFGRAGDEYKLPVPEAIPDATTDPSQINVVPVVDPTVKKPATDSGTGTAGTADPPAVVPTDGSQSKADDPNTPQPVQTTPDQPQANATPEPGVTSPNAVTAPVDPPAHVETAPVSSPPPTAPVVKPTAAIPRPQTPQYTPLGKVPSSLKSQMATMVPDASGNKPIEAALPAIEPVDVPELTERALLRDQPPVAYPASAGGKQGTVALQVLIGRDGTVQDAKFLQGSLVFARAAIDGVKQWKFKPYTMNGRPVSVETTLTLKFAPAQ